MPGEVRIVRIFNWREEGCRSDGKPRPAVLVRRDSTSWLVMGLTTNPIYQTGDPRVPVPNPTKVGVTQQGFLWGSRLTRVSTSDVHKRVGWADGPLVEAIIDLTGLGGEDAANLRKAAAFAHYGIVQ